MTTYPQIAGIELILNLERTQFFPFPKQGELPPKKVVAELLWDFFSRGAGLATQGQQQRRRQEKEEEEKRQKAKGPEEQRD